MIESAGEIERGRAPAGDRSTVRVGYASFVLIGWAGLLVPSLIRSVETQFGQSDAGLGVYYFLYAVFYATGAGAAGFLTERFGRRVTLPLAAVSLSLGLAMLAVAPIWSVFLAASGPFGLGAGAIDAAVNGVFLELHPGRGGPLNLLHVYFSVGAFVAPLALGLLVASGASWPGIVLATAVAAALLARGFAIVAMPSGRRQRAPLGRRVEHDGGRLLNVPLLLLGLGIATYVACEIGVSSWLVRFLAPLEIGVATAALSLFWAGLAVGRLVASRIADRFRPIRFAAGCASLAGVAVVAAVLAPHPAISIALFGVAGLAQGPVYPMIMAIAGSQQPERSGAVSGFLTASAVVGGLVYPPVIGFISVQAGIGAGILGAGALGLVSGLALIAVGVTSPTAEFAGS